MPGSKTSHRAREQITLEFKKNALMAALAGGHNRHFARLEQRLGVKIAMRGNLIAVEGTKDARESAAAVLQALYARLEAGEDVAPADIDTEIRFAQGSPHGGPGAELGAASLKTAAGRVTRARSAAQIAYLDLMRTHELVFGVGPAGTGKTYLPSDFGNAQQRMILTPSMTSLRKGRKR